MWLFSFCSVYHVLYIKRHLSIVLSAKQKLEDRLAAAAREKLAQAAKESKEKQLQAERKRKAALFLQTLKNPLEMETGRTEENNYSHEVMKLFVFRLHILVNYFLFCHTVIV